MKFSKVKHDAYNACASHVTGRQWQSDDGRWTVQMDALLFGVRCNLYQSDDPTGPRLSYCCGANRLAVLLVPHVMMRVLENHAGDLPPDPDSIIALFPTQTIKPMHNDLACWRGLCDLAGVGQLVNLQFGDDDGAVLFDQLFTRSAQ